MATKKDTSFSIIRGRLAKLTLRFGSLEKDSTSGYLENGYYSWPLTSPQKCVQGIAQGTLSKGNSEEQLICWQTPASLCRWAQGRRQRVKWPLKRLWMWVWRVNRGTDKTGDNLGEGYWELQMWFVKIFLQIPEELVFPRGCQCTCEKWRNG